MKKKEVNLCDNCQYNKDNICMNPNNYEIIIIGRQEKRITKVVPKQGKCPYEL